MLLFAWFVEYAFLLEQAKGVVLLDKCSSRLIECMNTQISIIQFVIFIADEASLSK